MKRVADLPLPQRILRGAFITFAERGYDKASMDEVAAIAGTTKRTVYAHFTNKESLFRAAIGMAVEWFLADLPRLDPAGDPEDELVRFASHFSDMSTWQRPVLLQRVVISEAARMPDLSVMMHRAVIEGAERRLAAFLAERYNMDGDPGEECTEVSDPVEGTRAWSLARLFLNMTTGPQRFATLMAARTPAPAHPAESGAGRDDAWVRFAVRHFVRGLVTKRAGES